jgi:phytoene desaturase
MARVVVVGAGVGGLTAAVRLAAAGHRVTVFEQAPEVGGKLGRFERDGFRFDTGPSLLTLPQLFADLELDLIRLEPVVRHVFADSTVLDSTSDHPVFLDRIGAALGERAAHDWARLWRRAGRIWDASWRDILQAPVDSPWDLARLAWRLTDLAAIAPGRTLRGLAHTCLHDPRLRRLLDRYATYTGSDPRRAPAALAAIPYAELTFGGWYLRGGLSTLADALLSKAVSAGVQIELGTAVDAIEVTGGRVSGVRVSGRITPADIVVSNVDVATLYRDLLPDPHRAAALGRRSLGGFVLLLGVRGRTPGLAHHTVYFPDDYDDEFDSVLPRHGFPRPTPDPAIFLTVADDAAVRPDGHEAWFILVNAAPHGHSPSTVDWTAPGLAAAYADRVLAVLAGRGLDVRDRVLFREIRTPADLEQATNTPGGAIYGTPSHGLTGLLRPRNRGPVPGLFLVGGSTHPGGGLPMVTLSARIVATQIGPA